MTKYSYITPATGRHLQARPGPARWLSARPVWSALFPVPSPARTGRAGPGLRAARPVQTYSTVLCGPLRYLVLPTVTAIFSNCKSLWGLCLWKITVNSAQVVIINFRHILKVFLNTFLCLWNIKLFEFCGKTIKTPIVYRWSQQCRNASQVLSRVLVPLSLHSYTRLCIGV